MLAWLKNVPNADEMTGLMGNREFRDRIVDYVKANIHVDVDGLDEGYVQSCPWQTGISYSHPIDPDIDHWKERFTETEKTMARTYQVHKCEKTTCLRRDRHGNLKCKRRAPWPVEQETSVEANGTIHLA